MKIEVDPRELMSPEVVKETEQNARKEGLPFEIYVFKQYDKIHQNRDDIVARPAAVVEEPQKVVEEDDDEEKEVEKEKEQTDAFDFMGLTELGRGGTRAYNLLNDHFSSVEDLMAYSADELMKVEGFGKGTVEIIFTQLEEHGLLEKEEKEEAQVTEREDKSNHDYFLELQRMGQGDDLSSESITKACKIYQNAWDIPYDTAKGQIMDLIGGIYDKDDPDTFEATLEKLAFNLPAHDKLVEDIMDQAWELGEDQQTARERAIALTGKEFDKITFEEGNQILIELTAEVDARSVKVDDNFSF